MRPDRRGEWSVCGQRPDGEAWPRWSSQTAALQSEWLQYQREPPSETPEDLDNALLKVRQVCMLAQSREKTKRVDKTYETDKSEKWTR